MMVLKILWGYQAKTYDLSKKAMKILPQSQVIQLRSEIISAESLAR